MANGEAIAQSQPNSFSPDVILMLLFALLMDAIDIVLKPLVLLLAPEAVSDGLDMFAALVIGGWAFYKAKELIQHKQNLRDQTKQRLASRQSKVQARASSARNPLRRTILRIAGATLGELLPLVGILPFWTITVISIARQK